MNEREEPMGSTDDPSVLARQSSLERVTITGEDGRPREIGRIDSVHLGVEDHGVFTFNLGFDFGGTHQGIGHLVLGSPGANDGAGSWAAGAARFLFEVSRVIGNIATAKGHTVMVVRDDDGWNSKIVGIQPLVGGPVVIFEEALRDG
jgi:hypothetical protein